MGCRNSEKQCQYDVIGNCVMTHIQAAIPKSLKDPLKSVDRQEQDCMTRQHKVFFWDILGPIRAIWLRVVGALMQMTSNVLISSGVGNYIPKIPIYS